MRTVKPEHTGWRDEALSRVHREWGFDCPMVDIDFICCEYDNARPVALIEYKNADAPYVDLEEANYRTLVRLADDAALPFFLVRYTRDLIQWRPFAINSRAQDKLREVYPKGCPALTQERYVKFLYWLRGREMPDGLFPPE